MVSTDEFRLIVDLSHPHGRSVNDGIPDAAASVSYCSLDSVLQELERRVAGTLLSKVDFKRAYRQVPVAPEDRRLLGLRFKGQFYVDLMLPFGGRSCAAIFNAVADVACFAFQEAAPSSGVFHYLDDFILLSGSKCQAEADKDFSQVLQTAAALGIPLSERKSFPLARR